MCGGGRGHPKAAMVTITAAGEGRRRCQGRGRRRQQASSQQHQHGRRAEHKRWRTCGVLEKSTSTGKVRPGILNTGTLPKKLLNFSASSVAAGGQAGGHQQRDRSKVDGLRVYTESTAQRGTGAAAVAAASPKHPRPAAPPQPHTRPRSCSPDVTMRRKSRRRATTFFRMPNSTSVLSERSCASSMMTALYLQAVQRYSGTATAGRVPALREGQRQGMQPHRLPRDHALPLARPPPPPSPPHPHLSRSGSVSVSRSSTPSVMYLMIVSPLVQSSKRME